MIAVSVMLYTAALTSAPLIFMENSQLRGDCFFIEKNRTVYKNLEATIVETAARV